MSDPAVQVIGLNRFVRQLKQLEPELLDELKGANKELAGRVESTARGLVPTRSGKLASSLRSSGTARSWESSSPLRRSNPFWLGLAQHSSRSVLVDCSRPSSLRGRVALFSRARASLKKGF